MAWSFFIGEYVKVLIAVDWRRENIKVIILKGESRNPLVIRVITG